MYAIIESGSHQFRVKEGDRITIDRQPGEPGSELVFERVLLLAGDGAEPVIGAPYLSGAKVLGKVLQTYRGKKIVIRKFKRRKNYRRKRGHRQYYTSVQITQVAGA
jgi:large subunit ribosomal protein L21